MGRNYGIEIFIYISGNRRRRGFSKAAEKLNYTQSTITFQIGQLEQELSAKLFEKSVGEWYLRKQVNS